MDNMDSMDRGLGMAVGMGMDNRGIEKDKRVMSLEVEEMAESNERQMTCPIYVGVWRERRVGREDPSVCLILGHRLRTCQRFRVCI